MMTLKELEALLVLNERLLIKELRRNKLDRRLFDLMLHRSLVKDTMIEVLKECVEVAEKRKLAA